MEILKCKTCGNAKPVVHHYKKDALPLVEVYCDRCGNNTACQELFLTEEEAIENWNRTSGTIKDIHVENNEESLMREDYGDISLMDLILKDKDKCRCCMNRDCLNAFMGVKTTQCEEGIRAWLAEYSFNARYEQ